MIDMMCISTFDESGKLNGITLERVYSAKWIVRDKVIIKNDKGRIGAYATLNFLKITKP